MLANVHIPVGISTEHCLSWSPDGELAIAAGEEVYILLPHHSDKEPWTHVRIPVNAFTNQEWPWQEQASFKDMAIGEEQAKVTIVAVAWSPSGLGKYRRSMLTVLTSNLLLSLWTSFSDSADPESWERVLIVNDALIYPSHETTEARIGLSQRVRSMAWAPTCELHIDRETPFSERKWGNFIMAITDDNNGIHIVKITSPFLGASTSWDAQSLCYNRPPISQRPIQRASLLSFAMNEQHSINDIRFCEWNTTGDITIVYSCRGIQYQERLSMLLGPPLQAALQTDSGDGFAQSLYEILPASAFGVIPRFQAQIEREKEKSWVESSKGEDVVAKTWGIAHFRGLQAVCITLHPSKMFEYTAPGEDSAVVLFDTGTDIESAEDQFPWQVPSEVDENRAHRQILDSIFHFPQSNPFPLSNLDIKIIYGALYATMLISDLDRLRLIPAISQCLNLLEVRSGVDLGSEAAVINNLQVAVPTPKIVRQMAERRIQAILESGWPDMPLLDSCPICLSDYGLEAIIYFDSLKEAYCPQKHPFGKPRALGLHHALAELFQLDVVSPSYPYLSQACRSNVCAVAANM